MFLEKFGFNSKKEVVNEEPSLPTIAEMEAHAEKIEAEDELSEVKHLSGSEMELELEEMEEVEDKGINLKPVDAFPNDSLAVGERKVVEKAERLDEAA